MRVSELIPQIPNFPQNITKYENKDQKNNKQIKNFAQESIFKK